MPAYQHYDTWFRQIRELLPEERVTRVRNLTWFIVGMHEAESIHLSHIAKKLPFAATVPSIVQRFRRFLMTPDFRFREWYEPVARDLLTQVAAHTKVRLIIDSTKIGTHQQLLMVALAYRKRALPIAWTWINSKQGHSSAYKQKALLSYVHSLIPKEVAVELVGDSEFGAGPVLEQLKQWGWQYALRQKGDTQVCLGQQISSWHRFDTLAPQRDKVFFYPHTLLTKKHLLHTHLLAYWETGEEDPWLLATNMPTGHEALRAYRRRMWIEETYGDLKGHGLDLEKTRLRHLQRLSRLVFVVALLYLWLVTRGSQVIKNGERYLVDRRDRRDLSIFRIGLDTIDRLCAWGRSFSIRLIPYF
jgi:hypothetical protein